MFVLRDLTISSLIVRILLAITIGGILGYERERLNRPAGLRTYMLVSLGACVCMIINQYVTQVFGMGDPVRMGAQVISGIGFLGAGSIITTGHHRISGLTTAAGLWAAACLGLATGIGFYELAILGGGSALFILAIFHNVDSALHRRRKVIEIYVEADQRGFLPKFVRYLRGQELTMSNLQFISSRKLADDTVCFVATVACKATYPKEEILKVIQGAPEIHFVEEI